jgi:hypothetical protein
VATFEAVSSSGVWPRWAHLRTETVFARAPLGAVSRDEPPERARCIRAAFDQIELSLTTQSRCLFVVNATAATMSSF